MMPPWQQSPKGGFSRKHKEDPYRDTVQSMVIHSPCHEHVLWILVLWASCPHAGDLVIAVCGKV